MPRTCRGPSEQQKGRASSPAVISEGGRIVWLPGKVATEVVG